MKRKCLLLCLLVSLIFLVTGITYSLFDSGANSLTDVDLASFLVDAKKTNHIDIPIDNINPGEEITYEFQVENNSDVNVLYNIDIKTMHFIPLNITLENSDDEVLMVCDESVDRNLHNELECKTTDFEMNYANKDIQSYKLKLEFPSEYNSEEYSSLVDYISLEINSTQKIS